MHPYHKDLTFLTDLVERNGLNKTVLLLLRIIKDKANSEKNSRTRKMWHMIFVKIEDLSKKIENEGKALQKTDEAIG